MIFSLSKTSVMLFKMSQSVKHIMDHLMVELPFNYLLDLYNGIKDNCNFITTMKKFIDFLKGNNINAI